MSRGEFTAFPIPGFVGVNGNVTYPEMGVSIREYFAGLAMQGCLANITNNKFAHPETGMDSANLAEDAAICARYSVAYTDALIVELAKPAKPDPQLIEAREIISNLKAMVKQVPEFNHQKYDSFGIRLNKFLGDTRHLVQP